LQRDPNDAHVHDIRAHALASLGRLPEAIEASTDAIRLRPKDAHLRAQRGMVYQLLGEPDRTIDDWEAAGQLEPGERRFPVWLTEVYTARAWELATYPEPGRDPERAATLARRAVESSPWDAIGLSTLGVALSRAGRHAESIAVLERSLEAGHGETEACDLFFLAMAHHRLGHSDRARAEFEHGARWMQQHPDPFEGRPEERTMIDGRKAGQLAAFRAEAEAVLFGPRDDLPDDVFAAPR
jgi:tetratricopeptide (TPR) repeat protein